MTRSRPCTQSADAYTTTWHPLQDPLSKKTVHKPLLTPHLMPANTGRNAVGGSDGTRTHPGPSNPTPVRPLSPEGLVSEGGGAP
jgi:hypothetical protein